MPTPGIYGWSPGDGGVHFHRIAEPLRVAARRGVRTATGKILSDPTCRLFDTILVHMLHDERNSEAWEQLAARGDHRLVFDIDDVMWAPEYRPFQQHYTPAVLERLWRNIALAHVVTTPTQFIADYVRQFNTNVHVVPNTVPAYVRGIRRRRHDRRRVGFQGSHSHDVDLTDEIAEQLARFICEHPGWDMHFWGNHETHLVPGRTFGHPWVGNFGEYYHGLGMDIGIGPLKDCDFNRGKSSLRAIEYSALGIVPVLADLEPYHDIIDHGVNGLLVKPGGSWYEPLAELADDTDLLRGMRLEARRRAAAWTTEANISRWTEAWSSV